MQLSLPRYFPSLHTLWSATRSASGFLVFGCIPASALVAWHAWSQGLAEGVRGALNGLPPAAPIVAESADLVGWGLVVFGALFWLILSAAIWLERLRRPLDDLAEGVERCVHGDLSTKIDVQGDERVERLNSGISAFAAHIGEALSEITGCATGLSTSSDNLVLTAEQLHEMAEEATGKTAAVATSSTQMSAHIKQMASATESLSENMSEASEGVGLLTSRIADVASSASAAAEIAERAASGILETHTTVTELGETASEIGKVIEMILGISEQTDLLALNATIEAARAGDFGKGFAVVASEVKALSGQTRDMTDVIREQVERIQSRTCSTAAAIDDLSEVIGQVNGFSREIADSVSEQSEAASSVADHITRASGEACTVSQGLAEAAAASTEVSENIRRVDVAAAANTQGVGHTQAEAEHVADLATELAKMAAKYKTSA